MVRYRYVMDDVAWVNSDYIGGWGAFDGYSGEVDFSENDLCYDLQSAHLEHDRERDAASFVYSVVVNRNVRMIRENVPLERVPCNYGGSRVYFKAPCCGKRVRVLALLPEGVSCRTCGRITYASCRKSGLQRLIHKANMLAGKLECDNWFSEPKARPKHMHRATFDKLADEHAALVRQAMSIIQPRLMRAQARGQVALWSAVVRAGL